MKRRIRVIPVLLIQKGGLVKTTRFSDSVYVGDPINAVKIFNEKEVDEIIVLDISEQSEPDLIQLKEIAEEAFMPFAYGGHISKLGQVSEILNIGVEKVILNTAAVINPSLITEIARSFGSQSIVVSIDVKKNIFGKYLVCYKNGKKNINTMVTDFAKMMQDAGAGELMLQSIERDGMLTGYDIQLLRKVSDSVSIPVIACSGARNIHDFADAVKNGGASAVAAGSLFVFHGKHKAVLINFPDQCTLERELYDNL